MSGFWEKRRAAVAAEARAEAEARLDAERAAEEQALAEKTDEELLAEAGQPLPEDLETAEQVRDFMKSALPQRLKTRALRKLWRTNPVLANLDGLVDYGEDYTDAARCVPDMKTVYQVGKGMFDKVVEAAKEAEAKAAQTAGTAEPAEEEDDTPAPELVSVREPAPLPDPPTQLAMAEPESDAAEAETGAETHDSEDALPATARRMRFVFAETEGQA
ncbi:DUF3306 domain-containing protein [Sagittula stellata]|uniref:DUF3306 domain-containing protein n=1 Tax=Sagittula stellata (strain ATCC 700073 / DSM 11524 / E-37) TaxID=388399 RepID=A3KAX1_SAGS3|nr:DUF3306 domain-containing protein [Sagittula stellata]EBA05699.1 hypothetical protein SSE37_03335 [Sagittula stellata E-37]